MRTIRRTKKERERSQFVPVVESRRGRRRTEEELYRVVLLWSFTEGWRISDSDRKKERKTETEEEEEEGKEEEGKHIERQTDTHT